MNDEDELTPVEKLAFKARQTGPEGEQSPPRLKMISFRVPVTLVASVDAFASITAQSRNATMINLLEAGIFAVSNALDDPEQFAAAREHYLEQHLEFGE